MYLYVITAFNMLKYRYDNIITETNLWLEVVPLSFKLTTTISLIILSHCLGSYDDSGVYSFIILSQQRTI